jgi:aspartate/methionine/tyrosine aminotransferase
MEKARTGQRGQTAMKMSSAVRTMPESGIREIVALARNVPDCIRLDLGEPHFNTPGHIVEAAHKAALAGETRYAPPAGLPSTRAAAAEKIRRVNGLEADPEKIIITNGATSGLLNALIATIEPGDEVLMPDPGWPVWEMMILAARGIAVRYETPRETGFLPEPDKMSALVTPRTRAIIINTPSNPTGVVMPGSLIEAMVAFARRHDLWVISDECYDEILFEGTHVSAAHYDTDDRVISVFSCSKSYAMTGWRLGYTLAPAGIAAAMAKLQTAITSSISTPTQKAAEAAFAGPQDLQAMMRTTYAAQRDLALSMIQQAGLPVWRPSGAFYCMLDVSRATDDTYAFAKRMVAVQKVSVAPGETFGNAGAGLVRLSLATTPEKLEEGLSRLLAVITG